MDFRDKWHAESLLRIWFGGGVCLVSAAKNTSIPSHPGVITPYSDDFKKLASSLFSQLFLFSFIRFKTGISVGLTNHHSKQLTLSLKTLGSPQCMRPEIAFRTTWVLLFHFWWGNDSHLTSLQVLVINSHGMLRRRVWATQNMFRLLVSVVYLLYSSTRPQTLGEL